jgi:hypothetical protein
MAIAHNHNIRHKIIIQPTYHGNGNYYAKSKKSLYYLSNEHSEIGLTMNWAKTAKGKAVVFCFLCGGEANFTYDPCCYDHLGCSHCFRYLQKT